MNRIEQTTLQLNLNKKWIKSYVENEGIITIELIDKTICTVASNSSKYRLIGLTNDNQQIIILSKINPIPININSFKGSVNDENFDIMIADEKKRLLDNYQNACRLNDEVGKEKAFNEMARFHKLI